MPKFEDLTGQRFNRLVVLEKDIEASQKHHRTYWLCQCDCGKQKSIAALSLKNGATQSCGCLQAERTSKATAKDEVGHRYGRLTVLSLVPERNHGRFQWLCQCDCGNQTIVDGSYLRNGNTTSCGCKWGTSQGEQKIIDLLETNFISYSKEYKFDDLPNKRFDFAIFDDQKNVVRLIEFDGEQHFKPAKWGREHFCRTQESDRIKNLYALKHNIPLVRIPYWEKDNMTIQMLFSKQFEIKGEDYG